jgi:kanamycin nucleotidyltransferase
VTHEERIQLAQAITQAILRQHGDSVIAVAIYGSVAKEEDETYSDLEMWAVMQDPFATREQAFIYQDISVELSYLSRERMLAQAGEVTSLWPLEADAYHAFRTLFERQDFSEQVYQVTSNLREADFHAAMRQAMIETFENLGKLKNAWERADQYGVIECGRRLTFTTAMLIGLANRRFYPSLRGLHQLAKQMPRQPRDYPRLLDLAGAFTTTDRSQVYQAALELWENLQIFAQELGVDWVEDTTGIRSALAKA